jgi:hypothetical protein
MGILDIFGSAKPAPAAPAPTTPGNIPATAAPSAPAQPNTAPNGTVPAQPVTAAPADTTPLADFKDIWQTAPVDPNAPAKPASVFGDVDPKKFMEAAGKIDFSKAVTPEQLQAIAAGGEGAMKAFAESMNKVAQGVYAQSAFASTKIVENALAKSRESFLSELPTHIKQQQVSSTLRDSNPIFSNPAVQPIISALEVQMTQKYPNATATEITNMAKQYVEQLGAAFVPKPAEAPGSKDSGTDWEKFLLNN